MPDHIFISHSSKDDAFVHALRRSLEIQKLSTWVDSRELAPGDQLQPEIEKAIQEARAFILVLSHNTFNSPWVLKEVKFAQKIQQKKGADFKLIPLLLEGVEPAALQLYFETEPMGLKIQLGAGGIGEAMPHLLAALGLRQPEDAQPMLRPLAEPLEELLLELTDPCIVEIDGKRRAQATAKLTYLPAEKTKREVTSAGRFTFTSPLGPVESDELSWYLERYYSWPVGVFKQRAEKIEKQLPIWGKAIYDAVFASPRVMEVLIAWRGATGKAARRFTVFVDSQLAEGAEQERQQLAKEAATLLLSLPWELLHDGKGYLFHGAKPVLVRRRLPNRRSLEGTVAEPPIRILLVSPRPEDDRAGYIDHRVSALPLVSALETLGELVELTVLSPPTFPALSAEVQRARQAGTPYHVVHFDGHGVYRKELGLGGLCFEDPSDADKLEKRRSQIIDATDLAQVIRDHRIPLFFLEACQSAKAEQDPTASVAAALLDEGVASVVAMNYTVLVETAKRFVKRFYETLAQGTRVGEAMLAAQRALKDDSFRLKIFGAGRLYLQDWFVPVLYQEQEDLQLLSRVPSRPIIEIDKQAQQRRFGKLPETPKQTFIGRSKELLKLERLLQQTRYAVVVGQGGEGKTTLAAELARWLVRSRRFQRVAFVSLEHIYDVRTVADQIGRQLLPSYSVAQFSDAELLGKALQPIERALRDERTLILLDNMEVILPPARAARTQPQDIARFEPEALAIFFKLCQKLMGVADTRLLFTSREALPQPFDGALQHVKLGRLTREDAIELVQKTMTSQGLTPKEDEQGGTQPEIEALVEAVNRHARSLVLLAPYLSQFGVAQTTERLSGLMAELDKKYPNERERSLFASVELSLRRLSPAMREKIKPLGLFQGGAHLATLMMVLEINEEEMAKLVGELTAMGLAEPLNYGFLRFDPALCPYLWQELDEPTRAKSQARWVENMQQLTHFLYEQRFKDIQLSATLTLYELPNLMRMLELVQAQEDPETTVNLATSLEQLLAQLGKAHLLARVVAIRKAEAKKLGGWSHTRFKSSRMQIERLLGSGNFQQAYQEAQALLDKCLQAGEGAYSEAAYDIAVAHILQGRVLKMSGASEAALEPIAEAYRRFQRLAEQGNESAARMASKSLAEQGDCLQDLGRLDEAAAAYEKNIKKAEKLKDDRQVAVGKGNLGTVRLLQGDYGAALQAYHEALEIFTELNEPRMIATAWHQIGMVHEKAGQREAAEGAYRQSLQIETQQKNPAGEASSLNQLGNLYQKMGRLEEAAVFYRQAADKYVEIGDIAKEGVVHNNLADTFIKLQRYDDARQEIRRAIECDKPYGLAAEPWKTYDILYDLEQAVGNSAAAAAARDQAIQLYLAYRRAGGENHSGGGRLCVQFWQAIQENKTEEISAYMTMLANHSEYGPSWKPLVSKLQAILAGSRDPQLAADPALDYDDAAEILFLLERL